MFSSLLSLAFVALALPSATFASSHGAVSHRRHEAIAAAHHVEDVVSNVTEHTLDRRDDVYTNARLTYYTVGL